MLRIVARKMGGTVLSISKPCTVPITQRVMQSLPASCHTPRPCVSEQVAVGKATEAVSPPGSKTHSLMSGSHSLTDNYDVGRKPGAVFHRGD